jgi:hypothetical protein
MDSTRLKIGNVIRIEQPCTVVSHWHHAILDYRHAVKTGHQPDGMKIKGRVVKELFYGMLDDLNIPEPQIGDHLLVLCFDEPFCMKRVEDDEHYMRFVQTPVVTEEEYRAEFEDA